MEHILVIDDNRDIARMLADSWLPHLGYRASVRHNGAAGFDAAAELNPDLVLLDLQLPDVVGLDLLHDLRRAYPDVPVILMTAHGSERTAVEAFRIGIRNYLIKPFTLDFASEAINTALRERRLQREKDRLTAGLQQRVRELTVLSSIGRSMTALMDTDALLTRIVEAGVYLTQAEQGFLLLTDPATNELYLRAAKNLGEERAQTLRMPINDTIAGQVITERKAIRISQRDGDRRVKLKTGFLVRSLLQVPLRVGETAIGVLGVDNAQSARPFSESAERLLLALADYGAIALENARLYRESQASEARYRDLFTNASDLLMTLDTALVIQDANAAGPRMLGYASEEIAGQPLERFCAPDSWAAIAPRLKALLIPGEQSPPLAVELIRRDGQRCFAEITARGVEHEGRITGIFCSIRDLSERRLLEAQMIHTEKLAAMEQLVGGVAHELNNPLTSILGYTQLLQRAALPATVTQDLRNIQSQASQAGKIVQRLTAFSRGMEPTRTSVQMNDLLRTVAELRTAQPGEPAITLALAENLPAVVADLDQMQQVLLQLLANARSALPPSGGSINLRTLVVSPLRHAVDHRPTSPVQLDLSRAVVTAISDTGRGIERDQLAKIFDPFWANGTPHAGKGLGLSMCYGIVTQHGGRIWAASQPGKGTTFYVALPAEG
jgi:two-component system NtrC family sensor kinase